ncbi:MAG: hypothetical protein ACPGXY_03190 [Alphaproteobacteria bacterium]
MINFDLEVELYGVKHTFDMEFNAEIDIINYFDKKLDGDYYAEDLEYDLDDFEVTVEAGTTLDEVNTLAAYIGCQSENKQYAIEAYAEHVNGWVSWIQEAEDYYVDTFRTKTEIVDYYHADEIDGLSERLSINIDRYGIMDDLESELTILTDRHGNYAVFSE